MEDDVRAVISQLDRHRTRFIVFCRELTGEELDRPVPGSTWLVRDFIAHLATIDGPVTQMFRRFQGDAAAPPGGGPGERFDVDRWNDRRVEEQRGRSVRELFAAAEPVRAECRQVLAAFTPEQLTKTMNFGGDSKRPATKIRVVDYLRSWCKHDPIHVADMLRALPERRDSDLEHWLDDPVVRGYQAAMNR